VTAAPLTKHASASIRYVAAQTVEESDTKSATCRYIYS